MGHNVHNHSTTKRMSQPPISIENMGFARNNHPFEACIFTKPIAFHGSSISNHDLEVVHNKDVTMSFLGYMSVNEVMGATTIN
jgi:hypothetical protein